MYGEYLHRSEGREATGDGRASHHPESDMKHFRAIHPDLYAQVRAREGSMYIEERLLYF